MLIRGKLLAMLKGMIILLLLMIISLMAFLHWKGDRIVQNVLSRIESQLQDSLRYETVHMEWFSHFPSVAIRIGEMKLGSGEGPLFENGNVDIILALLPLLKEKIVIRRLSISKAHIHIIKQNSHWNYDVFKNTPTKRGSDWNAFVNEITIEQSKLDYNDQKSISLSIQIDRAKIKGLLSGKLVDANIEMQGSISELSSGKYKLPSIFSVVISGNFKHDFDTGSQEFSTWKIINKEIELTGFGSIHKVNNADIVGAEITCKGKAEIFKQFVPEDYSKPWKEYSISGNIDGKIKIHGNISENEVPHTACELTLNNGSIHFPDESSLLKEISLTLGYDSGEGRLKKNSFLLIDLTGALFKGQALHGNLKISDLNQPQLFCDMHGAVPAVFLNVLSASDNIHFQSGIIKIDHFKIPGLALKTFSMKSFIEKCETGFVAENIKLKYQDDNIEITQTDCLLAYPGKLNFKAEKFEWNKFSAGKIIGIFDFKTGKVNYSIKGSTCKGDLESEGNILGIDDRPVMDATWILKGVEIQELMSSFDNFNQKFITSKNINGKTNVWAHVQIPVDGNGNIFTHELKAQAAITIVDGELRNMKTLEDFSKYIHLDDLRDIRFNTFRNYLEIESSKVIVPVVFIQSSAINLSVDGVHGFDQHITYNLKINAGQTAANKIKKIDPLKRLKSARKSGWINLYYVLSGTTSSVQYRKDQHEVIAGFEQSKALKERLRNDLVQRFGYDVYWVEPNEWEDIPEYR